LKKLLQKKSQQEEISMVSIASMVIDKLRNLAIRKILKNPMHRKNSKRTTNLTLLVVKIQQKSQLKVNGIRKIGKVNGIKRIGKASRITKTGKETTKNIKVNLTKKEAHMEKLPLQKSNTMEPNKKERNTTKVKESMAVGSNKPS